MSFDPIDFVRQRGIVLESAKGKVANLADAVAGRRIRGSWWADPVGKKIFRATRAVRDSDEILVCHLVDGKLTYVHRRLWPALVRLAKYFDKESLAAIRERHTASGAHRVTTIPFPKWVPASMRTSAKAMPEADAATELADWAPVLLQRHNMSSHARRR